MTRLHAFDSHLDVANRWLKDLMADLDLAGTDGARALHALRAGLHAIRDRLPVDEVIDLGAQLPTLIRGIYYEGWTRARATKPVRDQATMLARIQRELEPDLRLHASDVLRAVIRLLVRHVSDGEIRDILATLPKPIAALWHDLAGYTTDAMGPGARERVARRTGYSR